jgi:hypothetical protein
MLVCETGEHDFDFASAFQDKVKPYGNYIIGTVIRKLEVKILLGVCVYMSRGGGGGGPK